MADELDIIAFRRPALPSRTLVPRDRDATSSPARSTGWASPTAPSPARASWHASKAAAIFVVRSSCAPTSTPCRSANRPTWRGARSTTGDARLRPRRPHGRADGCLAGAQSFARFPRDALRALPAGRGVQPRRRVAGAGRRAFRRLRRAGRGRRARRTVARSGHLRIPARANTWLRATNCASPYTAQGATPHCAINCATP